MNAIRYQNSPGIGLAVLKLAQIRTDGGTQSRAGISDEVVAEYAEAIAAGADFPKIVVFFDGSEYWLADGFHRHHAHVKAGTGKIEVDVRQGTQRDAILFSVGANAVHGLRRTNDDKRRAASTLLQDDEWRLWNDVKIAEKCGVSSMFVGKVRKDLSLNGLMMPAERTVERNGTTYQQNTAAIGKAPSEQDVSKLGRIPSAIPAPALPPTVEVDDDEITAEDLANDPGFQKAVEALNNAKALYDEAMALPPPEPMTPEREAHIKRVFGTPQDQSNVVKIINMTNAVSELPAPADMVKYVPPTMAHAIDVVALLASSQWFEQFARAWEKKGASA